ncbi:DNA/RNA nuclease SfsA [Pleionea litopenaei]|uniref:Sugar fermentation stimulation protein homolog n=1 Tax=Pleionea litopenaei TaxID=3070815 RepID=A0AA51RWP6_9GAMM|nr:DNA/RNA nuclease SfsA [Pleionea sp. HL-JVS1]WMS89166.1 DNA/RNA nuclease SfsA [Pleionea sp. HL-JVS1]
MKFEPPLHSATLIKRYKRFLADVRLPNGQEITVHCPNTGSMKNCWAEGWTVYLQDSQNPKRKYQYTWVISETPAGDRIGVNTHFANKLVEEALLDGRLTEFSAPLSVRREVPYGQENSRIDLLLEQSSGLTYIEVKSVTLLEQDGSGYFPDAVSQRGQKHLRELIELAEQGEHSAALIFCVQHTGIHQVSAAEHIDPEYAHLLQKAHQAGVVICAYGIEITDDEMLLKHPIKVVISESVE